MQVILKNEDERNGSGEADLMDLIICIERNNKCLEGKCTRRFKSWGGRI